MFKARPRATPGLQGFLLLLLAWSFGSASSSVVAEAGLTFERDIRPLLKAHCFQCHGEGEKLKGGVDLRLRRFMDFKTDSGAVLVPGEPGNSRLLQVLQSGEMPKSEKKLSSEAIEKVAAWIKSGAPTLRPEPAEVPKFFITEEERSHWAFQPIHKPLPPRVEATGRARTAIDRFLLSKLEERQLSFAQEPSREILIRRLSLDLLGLPPNPAEVEAFVADPSPLAYEHLVDRFLASPHFGERWAVHWLDVVGYADSNGGPESDSERPWAWKYRDYIIRSLNVDKPFDQFITEQLAGDELVSPPYEQLKGEEMEKLIATGFLRMAPDPTGDNPADSALAKNQVIADTLQIVSSSLLGLTVQCAQCHDHRYDPIPQTDYYRLRAIFEPAFDWTNWKSPSGRSISLLRDELRKSAEALEKEASKIDKEAQALHDELIEAFVQNQLKLVPEDLKASVLQARRTSGEKRTTKQKDLLREFPTFQDGIILGEIDKEGAKKVEAVRKRAADLRAAKPVDDQLHVLVEQPGRTPATFRFHRGDHQQPKEQIPPGGLSILEGQLDQTIASVGGDSKSSGRRLAFAKMLTGGKHPLVARVLVNRFWHHLFGTGIVSSPGDFGALGERPSHPELLDWLASEFMQGGWRLKPLLRTLLTSSGYRQGNDNSRAAELDPDNRLLGRRLLKRLDAEALRDSLLVASGRLQPGMYGKPVPVAYSAQGQVVVGSQNRDGNGDPTTAAGIGGEEFRRSVYVTLKRTAPVGILETFDLAQPNPNCEARASSTVALQSLLLMNDPFVLARAADVADRVEREKPGRIEDQLTLAWNYIYGCSPTRKEIQGAVEFVTRQAASVSRRAAMSKPASEDKTQVTKPGSASMAGQRTNEQLAVASLCQALMSANRFLYVE